MSDRSRDPDECVRIGDRIGSHTVDCELGGGAVCRVYGATAPDGTRVAVKLMKPVLADDETWRTQVMREASIASSIRHPNVVGALGAGEHEGLPYIVLERIDGGSLADKMLHEGALDVPTTVRICSDVAAGLEALTDKGIVHGALTPRKIILDDQRTAHITCGLARETEASPLTLPGQTLGAIDYLAPEQIRGESLTPAADIYLLGCVTYECIRGEPPFMPLHGMRLLWAHLQDPPADPCAEREDAPHGFGSAVLRALEKDPANRPGSATAYAELVAAAATG